ncbi:MAG: VOC family protein [Pseudolabrys sp.]|nr:VOC family protein [Pseudolabrys sp.]
MTPESADSRIAIEHLRYVRLGTRDLAAATDFAQRILGLQVIDKTDDQVTFRSDDRDHTLVYHRGEPGEQAVAFEVRYPADLDRAKTALEARGLKVTVGTADEAARRKVRAFLTFNDDSGNRFELVVRPMNSGWRYFPSRDAGIKGLAAVAMRSTSGGKDEALWTEVFNGEVRDWAGDSAYVGFDAVHHRLALHPSKKPGVLAIEFAVEDVDLLMQNNYFLRSTQVKSVDGPGRRPTSGQLFLTFMGHDGVMFSFVAEGDSIAPDSGRRPRQFPRGRASFCNWGSDCEIPEFS